MTIASVQSSDDLSVLVEELGEHTELELMGIVEESNDKEDERTMGLQELNISVINVEFKDTLDLIAISFKH